MLKILKYGVCGNKFLFYSYDLIILISKSTNINIKKDLLENRNIWQNFSREHKEFVMDFFKKLHCLIFAKNSKFE